MEISIQINDALATNALSSLVELGKIAASSQREQIKSTADTQQFGLQTSGLQSLLSFIGTLITANLKKNADSKFNNDIMPILLGLLSPKPDAAPAVEDRATDKSTSESTTQEE